MSTTRISLPERYRVVRHVANGGMASVWEAHDELLDRAVAVKLLAPHLSEDDRARQRFQREARAAAGLSNHPHVVTIYDVGEHDGRTFMVMELLRGGTVADRLRAGGEVTTATALRWLHEAAGALDAAHEAGVVHRDVKPANMLLDERDRLAIADFGIARLALEDQLTATGQVLGTAAYISPEQAIGEGATAASDRYALAVVAFELLTGERPFQAENFAAQARAHVEDPPPPASGLEPRLPAGVDGVLERGLAKDPGERWASSREFVAALEQVVDAPPPARTDSTRILAAAAAAEPGACCGGRGRGRRVRRAAVARAAAGCPPVPCWPAWPGSRCWRCSPPSCSPPAGTGARPTSRRATGARRSAGRESTPTPSPTATASPEPTPTASPEPTPEATPEPSGEPDLAAASDLQLQGFNARQSGDFEQALAFSQQALDACAGSTELDPCGYALYEKGVALNRTGRSAEAIPVLQQRLDQNGDNEDGAVQEELEDAQRNAGGGGRGRGRGRSGGDD